MSQRSDKLKIIADVTKPKGRSVKLHSLTDGSENS